MRKLMGVLAVVGLLLSGIAAFARQPAGATGPSNPRDMEVTFLRLLNEERAANGKAALVRDAGLDAVALDWAGQMGATFDRTQTVLAPEPYRTDCTRSALCHRPNLAAAIAGVEPAWRSGGENVGTGYDVDGLHRAFVNSPGHFANIIGNWNRVGVGAVVQPDGRIWVTFNFLLGPPLPSSSGGSAAGAQRLAGAPVPAAVVAAGPARLVPSSPLRVVDTRLGLGATRLAPGRATTVSLRDVAGRPADATGAVLNVTAVDPSGAGYLTVYPCGRPTPLASNVNFATGRSVPNLVNAALGPDDTVCLYSNTATDVVIDLNGWFRSGTEGARLTAGSPTRVFDSRDGGAPSRRFTVSFADRVPTGTTAVTINATVTGTTGAGYLTAYPCGGEPPVASNLNYLAGQSVANQVTVRTGPGQTVCFASFADTHLVVDLAGWYAPSGGDVVPVVPVRVLDTRDGTGGWKGALAPTQSIDLGIGGVAGVPSTTTAALVNVTVTGTAGPGYVTVYPCGQSAPSTSNVNFEAGETVANLVTVRLGEAGKICLYAYNGTDLVVDLAGYVTY